jgi:hypothetical protein
MNKIGRILLAAVVAGLALSIMGTATRLTVTSVVADAESLFKVQDFKAVLLGFFFDLATGFFYVLAFAVLAGGRRVNFVKQALAFWSLLLLLSVVPRAADIYRYFKFPDLLVLVWLIAWAVETLVVAVLVVLLYPKSSAKAQGNSAG